MSREDAYRPLPKGLTIRQSAIDGLGLFATKAFSAGHNFGVARVADDKFADGFIRTPLGGFFNHSEQPNCQVITETGIGSLISIKDVEPGDEITVFYTLYKPGSDSHES